VSAREAAREWESHLRALTKQGEDYIWRPAKSAVDEIERLRAINTELVGAAQKVIAGLNARIDAAPRHAVPVFDGIAELHAAIARAKP
jgi:hypothetical protein